MGMIHLQDAPRWALVLTLVVLVAVLVVVAVLWVRDERQARELHREALTPGVRAYPGGGVLMAVDRGIDLSDPQTLERLLDRAGSVGDPPPERR